MDRRRALTFGLAAAMLVVLLSALVAMAVDTAKCEQARADLPTNPDILAFKECAQPGNTSASCCRKLLPFAKYYDCLTDPAYKQAVNDFLAPVTNVTTVEQECLGD